MMPSGNYWTGRWAWARIGLALLPALALAVPALAAEGPGRDPKLSDSQQPGSVIVFPKFSKGTVLADGFTVPKTEIELGVVCPPDQFGICGAHEIITIHLHWVCEGYNPDATPPKLDRVCTETDFTIDRSLDGKATFSPNGGAVVSGGFPNTDVPAAPCVRGYLIGWVIDKLSGNPIKYDGLIGDAVIRNSPTGLQSYAAIPIQAAFNLKRKAPIEVGSDGALIFDGGNNHYLAVTGQLYGDVKFDSDITAPFNDTYLILLTLDVRSKRQNNPVFVDFNFYNETEDQVSTSWNFTCWGQRRLSDIDPNLTRESRHTRKGLFVTDQAQKIQAFDIADDVGLVTLLGLVQTNDGPAHPQPQFIERDYIFAPYNNSVPIPTCFHPNDTGTGTGPGSCNFH